MADNSTSGASSTLLSPNSSSPRLADTVNRPWPLCASTMATLRIDQTTYEGKASSLDDALDYLVPRPGNIWRHAMNAFPTEKEETVVVALTGACQANDDKWFMSAAQDGQCKNLVERFPVDAKKFVFKQGFVGRRAGRTARGLMDPQALRIKL
ncbi:hypothetical protein LZ30DRAFT_742416 [Colletotrichum cereale]|nr:hypothetical protein LZ30DRAFT_742416 [Colletotrichum cereale]